MTMSWRDGNRIQLLENGEQFFPRVFGAIRRAQHSVLLETFILFEDDVGNALHRELLAAAQRGVKIEMMVDGYGSPDLSDEFVSSLTSAGVRFLYYDPRPLVMGMRTNVFRRLHRKIVVVDGAIAFVGGINFSAEHNTDFGPEAKQDYAIEVKGPIV
ncbi:MAG: cardiolipin synthase ClsB, partial [Mixta calida]|nr:cardiolipin synthase ClsB [Mixta calida]